MKSYLFLREICTRERYRPATTHVLCNVAVANRWNYTRVLRQSDDSFGNIRRKSAHRQSTVFM